MVKEQKDQRRMASQQPKLWPHKTQVPKKCKRFSLNPIQLKGHTPTSYPCLAKKFQAGHLTVKITHNDKSISIVSWSNTFNLTDPPYEKARKTETGLDGLIPITVMATQPATGSPITRL